jgi:GDPmannose 4,6-dehydratase
MHYGDLTDATNLIRLVQEICPDELYNCPLISSMTT